MSRFDILQQVVEQLCEFNTIAEALDFLCKSLSEDELYDIKKGVVELDVFLPQIPMIQAGGLNSDDTCPFALTFFMELIMVNSLAKCK